ncbi:MULTISPECIES: GntR family transcriptional regulator [unclassified Streptomyces]|uniref:FadR/GntR family transcriptional regulator n=1 Tax=unclassified Streptomyces TaxID=2593676 RepID=UPI0024758F9C|nr:MULTISPECIES: GntR family transcriptional regulator [unclassified Streptomyces]MDH6454291.1 DNA-binding FadR family transcriptional regulator [Streptomyces sp. SAI-119]MDH6495149.1 DNA-binding FadR family transcriptional regulator [Streptomyces sp. SAI-149]
MPEVLRRHHSGLPAAAMSSAVHDASLLADVIDEWGGADEKGACRIARLVEEDLIARGWPQDASLGSEVELAERYGVGRAVVREAVRILEVRGTARMVRGPSGPNSGLRVREVDHTRTAKFLMGFVLFFGTTEPQLVEAEEAIQRVRNGLSDDVRNDADLIVGQVSVALDLFDDVLGAIRQMMSGNGAIPGNPTVLFAPEVLNRSRAGQITERILRECTAEQWVQGHRLGSEEDLCFRYGVDRGAFRQAVRILESAGAAETYCGRGRGLVSRTPRAGAVARLVACLLASSGIHPDIVMRIFRLLSVEMVALAAERATPTTCQQIATALSSLRRALDQGANTGLASIFAVEEAALEAVDNPLLDILTQSLRGYPPARIPERISVLSIMNQLYLPLTRPVLAAFRKNDPQAARSAQRTRVETFSNVIRSLL